MSGRKRTITTFVTPKDEIGVNAEVAADGSIEGGTTELEYTIITDDNTVLQGTSIKQPKLMEFSEIMDATEYVVINPPVTVPSTSKVVVDDLNDPNLQACSLCGTKVSDLAAHIVDDHTELQDLERASSSKPSSAPRPLSKLPPSKPVRVKGPFRQVKPVLRYPCDGCRTVAKTSDQLKKHMILAHNGHKNTSWMFCGDCDYATRVEDELINHVKVHQMFNVLKEDFKSPEEEDVRDDEDVQALANFKKNQKGDDYSVDPMSCGDCNFSTHYESELFLHVRKHMGDDDDTDDPGPQESDPLESESRKAAYIMIEDGQIICHKCGFKTTDKKVMLRHCKRSHDLDLDHPEGRIFRVHQTQFFCTLCSFKGQTKQELDYHKRNTIHTKSGEVNQIKHNPYNIKHMARKFI